MQTPGNVKTPPKFCMAIYIYLRLFGKLTNHITMAMTKIEKQLSKRV